MAELTLLNALLFVGSTVYQQVQARKMKKALDQTKGLEFTIKGEATSLPVIYGGNKHYGIRTYPLVSSRYIHATPPPGAAEERTPASGSNYSITSGQQTYIQETSYYDDYGRTVSVTIYWNGILVFQRADYWYSSSPAPTSFEVDGFTYHRDTLEDAINNRWRVYRTKNTSLSGIFAQGLKANETGSKNEYLYLQKAIAWEGINQVKDVTVDEQDWQYKDFKFGQRIYTYGVGGTADAMATANGIPSTNLFTKTAFSSMAFKLNRDDYNYNGEPEVAFFVEGMKVSDIVKTGNNYSLSVEKTFTRNPARILADYLTNSDYGRGLNVALLDLKSFYDAKVLSDTVVAAGQFTPGRINRTEYFYRAGRNKELERDFAFASRGLVSVTNLPNDTGKPQRLTMTGSPSLTNASTFSSQGGLWMIPLAFAQRYAGRTIRFYAKVKGSAGVPLHACYYTNSFGNSGVLEGNFKLQPFYQEISFKYTVPAGATTNAGQIVFAAPNSGDYFEVLELGIDDAIRDIRLYECNLVLDTGKPIRENIAAIAETLGNAEIPWSEGRYKLFVPDVFAPTPELRAAKLAALVNPNMIFGPDDVIRESITVTYPDASARYNQFTIKFRNELEDFKEDSVTWPDTLESAGSGSLNVYETYLAEDNGQPLKGETTANGITTPWHALAKAEELVRQSRTGFVVECVLSRKALALEPGDFFKLVSSTDGTLVHKELADLNGTILRVKQLEVLEDLSVKVEAYYFDPESLAWNVPDNVAYTTTLNYNFFLAPVTDVTFSTPATAHVQARSSGKLSWVAPEDDSAFEYQIDAINLGQEQRVTLGTTRATEYYLPPLSSGTYQFLVYSKTSTGRLSEPTYAVKDGSFSIPISPPVFDKVVVVYRNPTTGETSLDTGPGYTQLGYINTNGIDPPTDFSGVVWVDISRSIRLTSSGQTFTFDSQGSPAPSGQVIIFNASSQNLSTSSSYSWDAGGVPLSDTPEGGKSLAVADFGSRTSLTISVTRDGITDSITVYRLTQGSSTITVALSNESHSLSSDYSGLVTDYTGSGTVIRAWEGTQELQADSSLTNPQSFRVTSSSVTAGTITIGSPRVYSGVTVTQPNHSGMTTDSAVISYVIGIKTADGTILTQTKTQSLAKAKQGEPGEDAITVLIEVREKPAGVTWDSTDDPTGSIDPTTWPFSPSGLTFRNDSGPTKALVATVLAGGEALTPLQHQSLTYSWDRGGSSFTPTVPGSSGVSRWIPVTADDVTGQAQFISNITL